MLGKHESARDDSRNLRLEDLSLSGRVIAKALDCSRNTVDKYLADNAGSAAASAAATYQAPWSVNVEELATCRFVASAENVVLLGPPAVGKTHLAVALGREAIKAGHAVLFISAQALVASLAKSQDDGKLDEKLARYQDSA